MSSFDHSSDEISVPLDSGGTATGVPGVAGAALSGSWGGPQLIYELINIPLLMR
ncbi:hypothetical protein J6590_007047, partial [Homalodisca vitripennis]